MISQEGLLETYLSTRDNRKAGTFLESSGDEALRSICTACLLLWIMYLLPFQRKHKTFEISRYSIAFCRFDSEWQNIIIGRIDVCLYQCDW